MPPLEAKEWGADSVQQWEIVKDEYRASLGQINLYRLNLWRWDGAPMNPLYRVDSKPRMNPTPGGNGNVDEIKKTIRSSNAGSRVITRMVKGAGEEVDVDPGRQAWI